MAENRQTGAAKTARIPIKIVPSEPLRKPSWIRAQAPTSAKYQEIKQILRSRNLHTVCEEASCPNIGECFDKGTATFMILGDLCTRRCPFCDVGHGKPLPPDANEPANIAQSIALLKLKYVVITSVDRDDLRDGGAQHYVDCLAAIRASSPHTKLETLVPDFRGRLDTALDVLAQSLPDVLNHNMETVPRLYKLARPGADYAHSLKLLKDFKARFAQVVTKSGLMLGLGETLEEVQAVMRDLRTWGVDILTIGQYLQPSKQHLPIERYYTPQEFSELKAFGLSIGFKWVESGPLVRSSYHAAEQVRQLSAVHRELYGEHPA